MTTAYIGLGSNLGDGPAILQGAWQRIGEHKSVFLSRLSSPYLTAPVGMISTNWFTNAVGAVETSFAPPALLDFLLGIESEFGRTRSPDTIGYQDRVLDLDILFFGETVMTTADLTLPHPELEKRLFVLAPLAEIAPQLRNLHDGEVMEEKMQQLYASINSGRVEPQEISRGVWNES